MTQAEVRRSLSVWQKRLGLAHYRIELMFSDFDYGNSDKTGESPDTFAKMKTHDDYDVARLTVNTRCEMWDDKLGNVVIVHELLHIMENDTGVTVESLEEILNPEAWSLLNSRYNHEIERWIDRLAYILVELAGVA